MRELQRRKRQQRHEHSTAPATPATHEETRQRLARIATNRLLCSRRSSTAATDDSWHRRQRRGVTARAGAHHPGAYGGAKCHRTVSGVCARKHLTASSTTGQAHKSTSKSSHVHAPVDAAEIAEALCRPPVQLRHGRAESPRLGVGYLLRRHRHSRVPLLAAGAGQGSLLMKTGTCV